MNTMLVVLDGQWHNLKNKVKNIVVELTLGHILSLD